MTLGTARNFRRYGLGSMLIESIITMIENEGTSTTTSSSSMGLEENDTYETAMQKGRALAMYSRPTQLTGVLYLHVIIYNTGAIRMYERLGFVRVKEIQGK
jgi:ribosomal protein S18 acetylase RimI-like enzyme